MAVHFLKIFAAVMLLAGPLQAQSTVVPEGFESFDAYETAMFERIDELAAQKGVDIGFLYEDRAALQAEYEDASARNDAAGMAEARAMQAYIIRFALENLSD